MSDAPARDATQRFSDRVADYERYRPAYPEGVYDYLIERCGLGADDLVVDVGAGTGLSAKPWLARGFRVQAVEPNAEMRDAAARYLAEYARLQLIDATAESLPLSDGSAALITASQAFHWFQSDATRHAFKRVLQPSGYVALIWNERMNNASPFMRDYEQALKSYAAEYEKVVHYGRSTQRIVDFFAPAALTERRFDNHQSFDFDGLRGRVWSSSYAPQPGHPNHAPLHKAVQQLFERYADDGEVYFLYRTRVFTGQLP